MNQKIIKTAAIGTFLLCGIMSLLAQNKHEISLSGFGGLAGLNYKVTEGSSKLGFGGGAGLGYHFFFSPQWGIGTGVELAFFNAKYNTDGMNIRYMTKDINGSDFEFRCKVNSYQERQSAMFLQIPLMVQFQTGDRNQFYAALGGKVGIPLTAKYKTEALNIQNSGYYEYENYEYTTQQFLGFGKFDLPATDGKLSFKSAFFLSVELGGKFVLTDALCLYIGAYLDYGLNNTLKNVEVLPQFIEYDSQNPRTFAPNSILHSQTTQAFTEKIAPIAAGLKLRFAFGKKGTDGK